MEKRQVIELPEEVKSEDRSRGEQEIELSRPYSISHDYELQHKEETSAGTGQKHDHDHDTDNDLIEIKVFPDMPIKTIILTIFLTCTGIGFAIAGLVCYSNGSETSKVLTFLLFGLFLSIPGCYYGFFLVQAYRADSPEEREEILEQIPM